MLPLGRRAAAAVFDGHRAVLVRPDLHVVWRGGDTLPDPAWLAALASGHGEARGPGLAPPPVTAAGMA
jgi:hypothetical protein